MNQLWEALKRTLKTLASEAEFCEKLSKNKQKANKTASLAAHVKILIKIMALGVLFKQWRGFLFSLGTICKFYHEIFTSFDIIFGYLQIQQLSQLIDQDKIFDRHHLRSTPKKL